MDETLPHESDALLLGRLRDGDEDAFKELVEDHAPRLLKVAERYLGERAAAEDAVQEAFVSAFRALDRFEGRSSLATWLHRITVNAALQALRRRRARDEVDIEPLLPTFDNNGFLEGATHTSPLDAETLLASDDVRDQVREAIARLPEAYRNIVVLRDIEGLSIKEAARMLELTETNAKVRLHRARHALKALLAPLLTEGAL